MADLTQGELYVTEWLTKQRRVVAAAREVAARCKPDGRGNIVYRGPGHPLIEIHEAVKALGDG